MFDSFIYTVRNFSYLYIVCIPLLWPIGNISSLSPQRILKGPEGSLLVENWQSHIMRCQVENAVGTVSWTRDRMVIAKNWTTYLDKRFSIITNSGMLNTSVSNLLNYIEIDFSL